MTKTAETVPACSHGRPMIPAGAGAYPYPCTLADKHPDWIVYYSDPDCHGIPGCGGCSCWTVSPDHNRGGRS